MDLFAPAQLSMKVFTYPRWKQYLHLHVKYPVESFSKPLLLVRLRGQRTSETITIMFTTDYLNLQNSFLVTLSQCASIFLLLSFFLMSFVLLLHHTNSNRSMIRYSHFPCCPLTLFHVTARRRIFIFFIVLKRTIK